MTLGEHITTLRKRKQLSQSDFGKLVGTSGDIIGKYERDEVKPSIEVAIRIADALEVSLDYLVGNTKVVLDKPTLKRLQEIQSLNDKDEEYFYYTIDALLRDAKAKSAYK